MSRRSAVRSVIAVSVLMVGTIWLAPPVGARATHRSEKPPACSLLSAAQAKSILAPINKLGDEINCTPGSNHASARWNVALTRQQLIEGANVPEGGFELKYLTERKGYLAGIGLKEWGIEFCLGDQSGPARKEPGVGQLAFYCNANGSIETQQGETAVFISVIGVEPAPPEYVVAKVLRSVLAKLTR